MKSPSARKEDWEPGLFAIKQGNKLHSKMLSKEQSAHSDLTCPLSDAPCNVFLKDRDLHILY
jgi:hypothetical protein